MKTENKPIHSKRAPDAVGNYPHARKVDSFLFLSGVGPRAKGSKDIPGVKLSSNGEILTYDIEAQTRSMFQNIRFILEDAGSSWEKLIDITIFLTNMKQDFPTYNKIYAELFPDPKTQPCRTTVEITKLPTPIAIEAKCIALID